MNWSTGSIPNQEGRIVLVTGANSGLGFESARVLLKKRATLILGCRSIDKAEDAKQRLLELTGSSNIFCIPVDLADLSEVSRASDEIARRFKKLDLLINNAGVMAPPRTCSQQGLEIQFAVNHLGHMALTLKLLPLLENEIGGRVVTVSSGAQFMGKINWNDLQGEKKYDRWASYSQSKLANVMFALELDRKLKKCNLKLASLAAHPGLARTNLQPKSVAANKSWKEEIAYKMMDPIFQSSRMGALPQLLAATEEKARSGEHYGPRFNFRGYPKLCRVAELAKNIQERERLWQVSLSIIENFIEVKDANKLLNNAK